MKVGYLNSPERILLVQYFCVTGKCTGLHPIEIGWIRSSQLSHVFTEVENNIFILVTNEFAVIINNGAALVAKVMQGII